MLAIERGGRTFRIDVFQLAMPPDVAAFLDVNVVASPPENDDPPDRCLAFERLVDVLLERNDRAASVAAIGGDDRRRPAIRDPVPDAIRAETAEDDGMNCADPRAGQHGDGRLGNGRHVNDDAVAFSDLVSLQNIGETADFAMQLLVSE